MPNKLHCRVLDCHRVVWIRLMRRRWCRGHAYKLYELLKIEQRMDAIGDKILKDLRKDNHVR